MDILVGVHVGGDWNPGVDAAKISLDDAGIKRILKLSKRAKRGEILTVYDNTPDLGTSDLDLENQQVKDLAKLTEEGECMATKTKNRVFEGIIEVCAHRISFFYRLPPRVKVSAEDKARLTEEAESRATVCVTDGYVQGELNYESEHLSCTGWWKIENIENTDVEFPRMFG